MYVGKQVHFVVPLGVTSQREFRPQGDGMHGFATIVTFTGSTTKTIFT